MFVSKGFLCLDGVGGDTQDLGAIIGKGAPQAGEVDRLPGTARRVRAGIEKQHQLLAGVVRERDMIAAVAGQVEGGGLRALHGQFW